MRNFLFKIDLRDILFVQKGTKPSILRKKNFDKAVPYLDIHALENFEIREYTYAELGNIANNSDVLMVWDGSRSGLCFLGQHGAIGSTLMRLTPIEFNTKYVYYFIKSKFQFINKNTKGNSIPHVDPDVLLDLKIPYVPITEQVDIVKEIELKLNNSKHIFNFQKKQFINSLKSNVSYDSKNTDIDIDIIKHLQNFKQSVLRQAYSGELSSEYRKSLTDASNFSSESYEQYLSEFSVPDSWKWNNFKNISQISVGATPKRSVKAYWGGHIPWVSSGEVNNSFINASKEKITKLAVESTNLKLLSKGTILMAMVGEGKTRGQVGLLKIEACTNQNVCAITLNDGIDPLFVFYYLQMKYLEIRNESINARSSSSQSALNSIIVGNLNICLPSYEEQKFISQKIEKILKIVDKLQIDFNQAQLEMENLELAILSEAYIGSYDEPNSVKHDFEKLLKAIETTKTRIEEDRNNIRKVQAKFKKEHFMKNIKENIISEIKKEAYITLQGKDISNDDKINLFESLNSSIPDMDFDDFSKAFLELAQEKLFKNDPDPFFIAKSVNGKLVHTIINYENSVS
ncbi:restriction endonuclease subunit S [Flavobacterium sp.]|uniref:restriction endonuclease subunit S n=1 Tax=Flavobacterium sp. TaxID=239 RepID=UPI0026255870|nr:restriction endonuclease subunit S [Flavobacterium sp.]